MVYDYFPGMGKTPPRVGTEALWNAVDEITELKKRIEELERMELPGEIYTIAWIKCGDGPSRPVKFYVRDYRRQQDQNSRPE